MIHKTVHRSVLLNVLATYQLQPAACNVASSRTSHNYSNTEVMYFKNNWEQTQSRSHTRRHLRHHCIAITVRQIRVFLSAWHQARPFYREESLHPPGHIATAAVPTTTTRADRIRDSHTGGTPTMISASVLNMPSDEYDIQTTCWMRRYQGRQQYVRTVIREQKQWNGSFVLAMELGQDREREIWNILEQWFPTWGTRTPRGTNQDI